MSSSTPKYKLLYWDSKGRAEPARQMFAIAGVEFEDYRFTNDEWERIKESESLSHKIRFSNSFRSSARARGERRNDRAIKDDQPLFGSKTRSVRLSENSSGLAGLTEWEQAQAESLQDQYDDYFNELIPWFWSLGGYLKNDVVGVQPESCFRKRPTRRTPSRLVTSFIRSLSNSSRRPTVDIS